MHWANRTYLLHLSSTVVSTFGSAAAPVAIVFTVLGADGSAADVSAVTVAGLVPALLFFLVGGVVADRWPRNLVLVGAGSLSALTQAALGVLVLTGSASLGALMAAAAVNGIALAFTMPASQGLLMRSVDPGYASKAFATFRLGLNLAQICGAALGGTFVAVGGPGWVLVGDAATFAVAVVLRLGVRIEGRIKAKGSPLGQLAEGWREFRSHRWLAAVIVQFAAVNVLAVGAFESVLGPVQANAALGGAAPWGTVLAFDAVGMVLGGLVMLRVKPKRLLVWALGAAALTVLPMLSMAAGLPLAGVCAAALLGGAGVEVFGVNLMTAMRQEVARDRISRVSAYQSLAGFGLTPVGAGIAGPIAGALGAGGALWATSAILLALAVIVLSLPAVRELVVREVPAAV
ncbi:MFS transporter [Amycolatopsis minnesotensis]|uniref:MFS transporter n=1 Tax=Amycolatopsis minnesotensis TaxID=337894 RepID=A0ABN2RII8_9PSEU